MNKVIGWSIALSLLAAPLTMNAAPIHYDEAVDGDLHSTSPYLDLGVGANTISGAFHPTDFDPINFRVSEGTALIGMQILMPRRDAPGILATAYSLSRISPSRIFYGNSEKIYLPTPYSDFINVFSFDILGPGDYQLWHGSMHYQSGTIRPHPYTWKLIVRSVPEPGTFALLGLGLIGMGYARRRKAS